MAVHTETPVPASEPSKTTVEGDPPKPDAGEETTVPTGGSGREARGEDGGGTAASTGVTAATVPEGTTAGGPVAAVGDSVMLGAVDALQQDVPNLAVIDARGNRQATEAVALLAQLRAAGKLGDVVVVHIGNNGVFTADEFDEMMRVLSGVRKVLVVNTTVPVGHSWAPNNEILAAGVQRHPNKAVLVDWQAASAGHPEYFWDGLHLTLQGASAYADLIAAAYSEQ